MSEYSKIVVTGGAGFIGSQLVKRLVKEGYDVTVVDNLSRGKMANLADIEDKINFLMMDLRHYQPTKDIIKGADVVFHLAAILGGIGYIKEHELDCMDNAVIDRNVIRACVEGGVKKLIYTSTACVYPVELQTKSHEEYLLKEDDATWGGASPESLYGWIKLLGEIALQKVWDKHKMKAVILRLFNVYGETEVFDPKYGHVIPALISKVIMRQNPLVVWGSGEQSRAFTYVDDVVDAYMLAMEKLDYPTPVNIGTPRRVKIRKLAEMIVELGDRYLDFKPDIVFDESKPIGVWTRCPDITRAKDLLGWRPKTILKEGLEKTFLGALKKFEGKG